MRSATSMVSTIALNCIGTLALVLGIIGIFLPLLPTTPFLLLAAACYFKASPRLYNWLMTNRYVGNYIRNYRSGNGVPLKTKMLAITVLWSTIGLSVLWTDNLHVRIFLLIVAVAVTVHLVRIKTLSKKTNM